MIVNEIGTWIAANQGLAAPFVALLFAWLLYGILGKRVLGADDDFWPAIRRRILPLVDGVARRYGLYAETQSHDQEYVGYVTAASLDEVERVLDDLEYRRNPLASYKTNPRGWHSDGSWAKRSGVLKRLAGRVGQQAADSPRLLRGGAIRDAISRFLLGVGDVAARKQDHVTLYAQSPPGGDGVAVHVYAHREPNSLNPVMAYKHYRGSGVDVQAGVQAVRSDLESYATDNRLVFTAAA